MPLIKKAAGDAASVNDVITRYRKTQARIVADTKQTR
jgi:hypothetical protein